MKRSPLKLNFWHRIVLNFRFKSHTKVDISAQFNLIIHHSSFFLFSNGSTNTLTNDVKENMTPILLKNKSHSAPESDSSSSIYDATPVAKKKLSLDGSLMKRDTSDLIMKAFMKEKCQKLQEKDLDEASCASSVERMKTISPGVTLTSVSDKSTFSCFCGECLTNCAKLFYAIVGQLLAGIESDKHGTDSTE